MAKTYEDLRLEKLNSLNVLDTLPERDFDDIVKIAVTICQTPIALVSLIDESRQWFKACVGVSIKETSRDIAFCDHTIRQREVMIVEDAAKDSRFMNNPLVTNLPKIRFYAGVPLWTRDGYCMGSLCVIDIVPRTLSKEQIEAMQALARQTMSALELRSTTAEANLDQLQAKNDRERLNEVTRLVLAGVYHLDKDGKCTYVNDAFCKHVGMKRSQALGYGYMANVEESDRLELFEQAQIARQKRAPFKGVWRVKTNGQVRHIECASEPDVHGGRVGVTYDLTDWVIRVRDLEKELREARGPMLKKAE